jgi:hypothetical protein
MTRGIENIGTIRVRGSIFRTSREFVGRLDGMNTNCAVEKGSGQHIRVARAPIHLESPVIGGRKLSGRPLASKDWIQVYNKIYFSNDFGSLRVPAESTVVFTTRK